MIKKSKILQKSNEVDSFETLLERSNHWFVENYIKISLSGKPLNRKLTTLAKKMGVKNVDRIRILYASEVEFFKKYSLDNIVTDSMPQINLNRCEGISYKYGIVIQDRSKEDNKVYAEMFRFIIFYEGFGSIKTFLNLYLRNVLTFGWEKNPFNSDAKLTAISYS